MHSQPPRHSPLLHLLHPMEADNAGVAQSRQHRYLVLQLPQLVNVLQGARVHHLEGHQLACDKARRQAVGTGRAGWSGLGWVGCCGDVAEAEWQRAGGTGSGTAGWELRSVPAAEVAAGGNASCQKNAL